MQGIFQKLAALAICCVLVAISGCAATAEKTSGLMARAMGKKTVEEELHIRTPDDHIKDLKELAKTADKKSPEEQQKICMQLAEDLKHEDNPQMRRHILRTLGAYKTPLAFTMVSAGLKDSDADVRRVACEQVGLQGGPAAVEELTRVVSGDTDADVRIAAVRALGHTGEKGAMAPLAEALADADPAMQFRAQEAGLANGRNPISIVVPCHRVIGSDGTLTGYGGGLPRKEWLLAHEGARIAAERHAR